MSKDLSIKNSIKFPTSIIVGGVSNIGLELAELLLDQSGYIVIIDNFNDTNVSIIHSKFGKGVNISLVDYTAIPFLQDDLRRLDYIFHIEHIRVDFEKSLSTQEFLQSSNYLDNLLQLSTKFEARFLLATSIRGSQVNYLESNLSKFNHTSIYTNITEQEYAESLVLEYEKNTGLNTRVLRVGEMIGDGVDLASKTTYMNIIRAAVNEQDIPIPHDGLDVDYFVHINDAAYALIKAQFTNSTTGKIYSVSYKEQINHLSLAYLVQEMEPGSGEIKFVKDQSSLPPLRVVPKSNNLEDIGWKPQVKFENAVKESLISMREALVAQPDVFDSNSGLISRILESRNSEVGADSALSRLIAERKLQQKAKTASIAKADKEVKKKRRFRKRTRSQRISDGIWSIYQSIQKRFEFLKYMTPMQFAAYLVIILFFGVIYFNFIAPIISFSYNSVILVSEINYISGDVDTNAYSNTAKNIKDKLEVNQQLLLQTNQIANIIGLSEVWDDWQSSTEDLILLYGSVDYYGDAAVDLLDIQTQYVSQVSFRNSSESYISSAGYKNLSKEKEQFQANRAFLVKAKSNLENLDSITIPSYLTDTGNILQISIPNQITFREDLEKNINASLLSMDILFSNEDINFLVLVVDNSLPQNIGGNVSAIIDLRIRDLSLAEAKLYPVSIEAEGIRLSPYLQTAIEDSSFDGINDEEINIATADGFIDNQALFEYLSDFWLEKEGIEIDHVTLLSLEGLGFIQQESIQLEGQEITSQNFLAKVNELQTTRNTQDRRSDLIAASTGQIFTNTIERFSSNDLSLFSTITDLYKDGHIKLVTDKYISEYVPIDEAGNETYKTSFNYIQVDYQTRLNQIQPLRYPAYNVAVKSLINQDLTSSHTAQIKFPAIQDVGNVNICVPSIASNLSISGISSLRYRQFRNSESNCLSMLIDNESQLTVSWNLPEIAQNQDLSYNYTFAIPKPLGFESAFDVEIDLDNNLEIEEVIPNNIVSGGDIFVSGLLERNLDLNIKFK